MVDILRNMTRRKLRSTLTVLGIVIGVFALTVMGAMAEKMNLLVAGGLDYYSGHVTVVQGGGAGDQGLPMSTSLASQIERVPGAAAVVPSVQMLLKTDGGGGGLGMPDMIVGTAANEVGYEKFKLTAAEGVLPGYDERGVVAVGSSIAKAHNLHVGDTFMVRGKPFTVKALLSTTMTAPDSMVRMSLLDAQELYVASLPPLLRGSVQPTQVASMLNVYPMNGLSGDTLAERIKHAGIADLKVTSPTEAKQQFEQFSMTFNLIVIGSALVALIVGALSVINTMAMSVAERVKEIGLKKAIGARTGQVLREFLGEAAMIGLVGGLIGLGVGSLLVTGINSATMSSGTQIFVVTSRLAIGTIIFATVLGAVAGFFPALRASRLSPVEALRAE
ncbi:MAG: ABC transporter permease [Chloroflexota bacterium]